MGPFQQKTGAALPYCDNEIQTRLVLGCHSQYTERNVPPCVLPISIQHNEWLHTPHLPEHYILLDLQIDRKDWIECKARNQQDRQCTHNITLRHIVQLLLQWKSSRYYIFWLCVSSLRHAACNVHVSYCHLWPAQLYCIFSHCLINGKTFKKVTNVKCVFWFSLQLLSETFLILRRIEWDKKRCTLGFM